jgi:membrane-associated phospholipid phosphatase
MLVITATLYLSRLGGMPVERWPEIHLAMLLVYFVLSRWMARGGDEPWVSWVRAGAVIALMFSLYSTLGHAVFVAIPWSGDAALNAIDQWLFGGVPPALRAEAFVTVGRVEFFSFCYGFFIPYLYLSILTGLVGRPDAERQRFVTGFAVLYAISFLGYLFVPARGPIVHNAMEFAAPLAGGTFHGLVVQVIDAAGGPHGAFPSLHVGASAYACLFDLRYNRLRGFTYLPLVVLIAMATVLLRYHYVIDLLAGLLLALMAAVLSHRWMARWEMEKAEAA